ncbi:MAG: 16S rRNA (guanine(527)-N(7))-methyltransferase RsmG [Xanthomonadales bacterium]|nr:16S rRNA (guanine(527)-N(7))-methyltransferase RsmG [Xanthomonadales bacterium]
MLREQLTAGLNELGLTLQAFQIEQLLAYVGLLEKWNKTYNLTAVRKPRDMISHHLLDSLAILPWVSGDSLVDVGSGAGLPGIPLAIARPNMAVTLVDSLGKRCRFLSHVVRELKLSNISVVESRAEDWTATEQPALITARAVAALPLLLEQTRHLFASETVMLAAKGRWPQLELEALPADFCLAESIKLNIPGVAGERHLLRITLKNNQ